MLHPHAQQSRAGNKCGVRGRTLGNREAPLAEFAEVLGTRGVTILKASEPDGWRLESPPVFRALGEAPACRKALGEICQRDVLYGIKTGLNEALSLTGRATTHP